MISSLDEWNQGELLTEVEEWATRDHGYRQGALDELSTLVTALDGVLDDPARYVLHGAASAIRETIHENSEEAAAEREDRADG